MKKSLLLLFSLLIFCHFSHGTHLRGGEISVRQMCNSLTFEITVTVFTNTLYTNVLFGGEDDWLNFGDGTKILIPETPNTLRPDLGEGMATASFTIEHTYPSLGNYLISYSEPNRNEGILNMDGSVATRFYIENYISIGTGCYGGIKFINPPILTAASGSSFSGSIAGYSPHDNRLFYEVVQPKMEKNTPVMNYRLPENFKVNLYNGLITWDTKVNGQNQVGEYSFAVKISEFDKDDNLVAYVVRDFQIIVKEQGMISNSLHDNVNLDENARVYVPENETSKIKVFAESNGDGPVSLSLTTEVMSVSNAVTFSTYDSTFDAKKIKVGVITMNTTSGIIRDNPYVITVRAKFSNSSGTFFKDVNYLYFTKDVQLVYPDIVLGTESVEDKFRCYPNPVKDLLFLEMPHTSKFLNIVDVHGKIVPAEFSGKSLNLSWVSPGVYFVRVSDARKKIFHFKIIRK